MSHNNLFVEVIFDEPIFQTLLILRYKGQSVRYIAFCDDYSDVQKGS